MPLWSWDAEVWEKLDLDLQREDRIMCFLPNLCQKLPEQSTFLLHCSIFATVTNIACQVMFCSSHCWPRKLTTLSTMPFYTYCMSIYISFKKLQARISLKHSSKEPAPATAYLDTVKSAFRKLHLLLWYFLGFLNKTIKSPSISLQMLVANL